VLLSLSTMKLPVSPLFYIVLILVTLEKIHCGYWTWWHSYDAIRICVRSIIYFHVSGLIYMRQLGITDLRYCTGDLMLVHIFLLWPLNDMIVHMKQSLEEKQFSTSMYSHFIVSCTVILIYNIYIYVQQR